MPEIRTDHRCLAYEAHDDMRAELRESFFEHRHFQLELARRFWFVDVDQAYVADGAASLVEWAARLGYSDEEARLLSRLGRGVCAVPSLRDELLDGTITPEAVAAIAALIDDPDLIDERDTWIEAARTKPLRDLRTSIRARIERKKQGDVVVPVILHVTEDTRQRFARARVIASEKVGRPLSDGEALSFVTDDFLKRHDPMFTKPGKRRVVDTIHIPHSRYIPVEVQRAVRLRAACRCEFPGCTSTRGLQFAHKNPHAKGSAREVDDLFLFCRRHHMMYDAGWVEIVRDDETELAVRMPGGFIEREERNRDPPPWLHTDPGYANSVCLPAVNTSTVNK